MNYQELETQSHFFKALANPARLQIILLLSQGEKCVCDINEALSLDMSVISRHLKQLQDAKILSSERVGKNVFYKLEMVCVIDFMACSYSKQTAEVCVCDQG